MISGREALAQLEQAISGVRADEDRLDAALASATDQAARARADQAAAFRRLAELRLDTLAQATVAGRIETVEREALDLLAEKRRQMAELGEKRRAANAALDAGQSKRHDQARRLEEIAGRIGALTEKTRARIASDAAWVAAAAAVREAEATLARARAKTEQAAADRVAKGAPYEADRLFAYLWAAGWGTSAYRGGFFAKFFDARVARIAAYDQARPNYAMLCELPVRLKAHTEGLAAQVAAATATRTAIERAALEADGIAALEAEFAAVKAEVDAGNAGLASVQSDIATLDASHAVLVSGDDPQLDREIGRAHV